MQYCEGGWLDGLIARYRRRDEKLVDEGILWKVVWDVNLASSTMWTGRSHGYVRRCVARRRRVYVRKGWDSRVHRDLKQGNVFMTGSVGLQDGDGMHYPMPVLGDWGANVSYTETLFGIADRECVSNWTPDFEPPEHPAYSIASDVWMLGLVVHCLSMMTFSPDPSKGVLDERHKSVELRGLIEKFLQVDPKARPRVSELSGLVWQGFCAWRAARGGRLEEKLPNWAFS